MIHSRLIVVIIFLVNVALSACSSLPMPVVNIACDYDHSAEVYHYGYDDLHSNSVIGACFAAKAQASKLTLDRELTQDIASHMPLYIKWNGDRYLILIFREGSIGLYSLTKNKITEKVRITAVNQPVGHGTFSLAYDSDNQIVYGIFYENKNDSREHTLFAYSLPTKKIQTVRVPLENIYSYSKQEQKREILRTINCRTSLEIISIRSEKYLSFGCSFSRRRIAFHRNDQGFRGVYLQFPLKKTGEISERKYRVFFPSKIIKGDLRTGIDTSLWNSGAGPILTKERLILATGNGPVIPEHENYGCSVLALNPFTLKPINGQYIVAPQKECHKSDLDLASSSIAATYLDEEGKELWGAVTGKDGILKVFDINDFSKQFRIKPVDASDIYWTSGQPAIFSFENKAYVFFSIATGSSVHALLIRFDSSGKWETVWKKIIKGVSHGGMNPLIVRKNNSQIDGAVVIAFRSTETIAGSSDQGTGSVIHVFDLKTGKILFAQAVPESAGYFSVPLLVDDKIYFSTREHLILTLH